MTGEAHGNDAGVNQARQAASSCPTETRFPNRTSGIRSKSGSSRSFWNHASGEYTERTSPSSEQRDDSRSTRLSVPNRSAKRRNSRGDKARSVRSTKWARIRRSEKNRSAFRVSALRRVPKTCTSTGDVPARATRALSPSPLPASTGLPIPPAAEDGKPTPSSAGPRGFLATNVADDSVVQPGMVAPRPPCHDPLASVLPRPS